MPSARSRRTPPDAQQHFLHDPGRAVAAVDMQSQIPVERFIFRPVGIQQIDGTAPDVDLPGLETDLGRD